MLYEISTRRRKGNLNYDQVIEADGWKFNDESRFFEFLQGRQAIFMIDKDEVISISIRESSVQPEVTANLTAVPGIGVV